MLPTLMAFWRRLFGRKSGAAGRGAPEAHGQDLDEMMSAVATVMAYEKEGCLDLVRTATGEVVGFWLGRTPGDDALQPFLRMAAASKKLDEATYISISLGDYRLVSNGFDNRGGTFVMVGPARAPGEQIPPLQSVRWRKGEPNPKSGHVVRFTEGVNGVKFLCPTCRLPNYCYDSSVADEAGAMVECGHCGNIAHVPAAYKSLSDTSLLEIRGCSYVPMTEFRDWFFAHPCYSSDNAEDWGSYGLWAYCALCKHQLASTVLSIFPAASMAGGLVFTAHSPASAKDMEGLLEGKCPACAERNLLALMIHIPDAVRQKIILERQRRASGS